MSPIKGLTDRNLSFPEIGQIRKGAKKTGNAPGRDLEFFRVEFDEQEKEAADKFESVYGPTPNEIRIILPFNDIPRMWDAWLEGYTAGRMVARADGEYFTYLIDTQTGEIKVKNGLDIKTGLPKPYLDGQVVGYWTDKNNKNQPIFCKPTGRLKVVIPELGRAAYLTVMTTSTHDIANISAQLDAFKTVSGGLIAGIPLILRRRPKKISCPNQDGTRARRVKWMLSIEADPQWMSKMIGHLNTLALPGGNGQYMALPSGDEQEVSPEEFNEPDEDIQDGEFTEAPQAPVQTAQPPKQKTQAQTATQPTNGNGNAPITDELWDAIDISGKLTTSKGTPLITLDREHLQIVQDKSKDGRLKGSATTLLAEPDELHWTAFYGLVERADLAGLMPAEPPENVCLGELRKLMHDIEAQLQAIQTPA